jgi:hypothetical protein
MLSLYLRHIRTCPCNIDGNLPHKVNSFDDEAQGWADRSDILVHYPFNDGRLARVVKAPTNISSIPMVGQGPYSINIRISLSFKRALRSIDNMVEMCKGENMVGRRYLRLCTRVHSIFIFIFLALLNCHLMFSSIRNMSLRTISGNSFTLNL